MKKILDFITMTATGLRSDAMDFLNILWVVWFYFIRYYVIVFVIYWICNAELTFIQAFLSSYKALIFKF